MRPTLLEDPRTVKGHIFTLGFQTTPSYVTLPHYTEKLYVYVFFISSKNHWLFCLSSSYLDSETWGCVGLTPLSGCLPTEPCLTLIILFSNYSLDSDMTISNSFSVITVLSMIIYHSLHEQQWIVRSSSTWPFLVLSIQVMRFQRKVPLVYI